MGFEVEYMCVVRKHVVVFRTQTDGSTNKQPPHVLARRPPGPALAFCDARARPSQRAPCTAGKTDNSQGVPALEIRHTVNGSFDGKSKGNPL